MKKLIAHREYLFGLAVALALVSAQVITVVNTYQPNGFKWG